MSINRVILTGRLARDVEFKSLPSGSAVVNNAMAVSHWRKDQNGQGQEQTSFIDVTFYGRTAEIVNQYLRKGSLIGIDGRLEQQNWKDAQTGQNRSKLVVIVENMQMLESKNVPERSDSGYSKPNNAQSSYSSPSEQFASSANYSLEAENDLPF